MVVVGMVLGLFPISVAMTGRAVEEPQSEAGTTKVIDVNPWGFNETICKVDECLGQ